MSDTQPSELKEIQEADSELRAIIVRLINYVIKGEPSSDTRLNPKEEQAAIEKLMVRERIAEIERIQSESNGYGGDSGYSSNPFYVVELLDLRNRIAELQKQQEREA